MSESLKQEDGSKDLELKLRYHDYFRQILEFKWPAEIENARDIQAVVTVTQPYGFQHKLVADVRQRKNLGEVEIDFPLIDEGRFTSSKPYGLWDLGQYRFEVELQSRKTAIGHGSLELDPNSFFGEIDGRKLAQVDSLRQFIECSPDRPAFIDHDEIGFTIRAIPERVKSCKVEVDVVEPEAHTRLADPIKLDLTGQVQHHTFLASGWPRGEYWLRVRILRENRPVGPFLVRQFWRETSFELKKLELPLRPGNKPQYMVDGWIFASSTGLRHEPDQLERLSHGPVVELDCPWEKGPDSTQIESLSWDADLRQHRITYFAGPACDISEEKLRGNLESDTQARSMPRYLCLAVSPDGIHWEKPDLGLVEFKGSKQNNILRDMNWENRLLSGEYDSYPVKVKERPIPSKFRYRFYDRQKDGPVDMDRFVFRNFRERNIEYDSQFEDEFHPALTTFWGLERRGDLFLTLTRQPVLVEGRGMTLLSTTERASTYPFEGDPYALFQSNGRSTSTFYDRRSKTFLYYFRPDAPAYPPNGLPYYLWHGTAAIRTRAVMWTRDGIHWERRHMLAPDEHDPLGATLYGFSFLRPVGHEEGGIDGQLFLGTLLRWDLRTQVSGHELVWSRDLVHWHRFGANRKALLPNGPVGSYDAAMSLLSAYYLMINADGEEEWWFSYLGKNSRYMLNGYRTGDSLKEFKAKYPYFQLAPFFTSWEDFYKEAQSSVSLPALARCKAGRLAHVEPVNTRGEFTTCPLVADGSRLLINAHTDAAGSIRVELQDGEGNVFPGLGLGDCIHFSGDYVSKEIRWKHARMEEINGRVIRIRFVLEKARLYTFRIGQ